MPCRAFAPFQPGQWIDNFPAEFESQCPDGHSWFFYTWLSDLWHPNVLSVSMPFRAFASFQPKVYGDWSEWVYESQCPSGHSHHFNKWISSSRNSRKSRLNALTGIRGFSTLLFKTLNMATLQTCLNALTGARGFSSCTVTLADKSIKVYVSQCPDGHSWLFYRIPP